MAYIINTDMRAFTKTEIKAVLVIFAVITVLSLFNFRIALRRSRDAQRIDDIGRIASALILFRDHTGEYPLPSEDGRIVACPSDSTQSFVDEYNTTGKYDHSTYVESLRPCEWAEDSLIDLFNADGEPFLTIIPHDPLKHKGIQYTYQSSGRFFQILAHLEGKESEEQFNQAVFARNINCGDRTCNIAKSSPSTPIDVSIKEYEDYLERERIRKLIEAQNALK